MTITSPKFPLTIKGKTYKVGDPEIELNGLKSRYTPRYGKEYIFEDAYLDRVFIITIDSVKIAKIEFIVFD